MENKIQSLLVLFMLSLVFPLTTAHALTCAGGMNTTFGPQTVRYELNAYDEAQPEGYVKYWGPGTGAWTEGRYLWIPDPDSQRMVLKMYFGIETNVCVSYRNGLFTCRSDQTPITWDMRCE